MPDTDPRVLAMAYGSPGEALALQEQGGLEALEQLEGALRDLPAMNWIKIHKLTDTLSRRGQDQAYTAFTAALLRMSAALPAPSHARRYCRIIWPSPSHWSIKACMRLWICMISSPPSSPAAIMRT